MKHGQKNIKVLRCS